MAFVIKRNDTRPIFKAQLTQTDPTGATTNQVPVDLTTATSVKFYMRLTPNTGILEVSGTAAIVDAATGKVSYTWIAADTDTAGQYLAEFEVSWGTDKQTFPSDDYLTITVKDDLGP